MDPIARFETKHTPIPDMVKRVDRTGPVNEAAQLALSCFDVFVVGASSEVVRHIRCIKLAPGRLDHLTLLISAKLTIAIYRLVQSDDLTRPLSL